MTPSLIQALPTYHASGLIGARAMFVAVFVGIPASAALGWGLAWAQSLAHGAIASSICAVLAALVAGVVFALVADHARSRNVRANTLGALALLVCLLLVRWWRAEVLPGEAPWSVMTSSPVSAWFSDAVGAVLEAFMLGVLTLFLSRTQARQPFSESAQQWAVKDMEGELWGESVAADHLLAGLKEHGVALLLNMRRAAELGASVAGQWRTVLVQGRWVEADPQSRWLTIQVKTHERDDAGKIKTRTEEVIEHWTVSADDYLAMKALLDGAAQAMTMAEAAQQTDQDAQATPTVLQPAVTALEAEQYSVCVSLAQAHCQHPDQVVQADAWRLCALAHARMNHWPQAFDHYHHLFELEPSTLNALQLATTSVMSGELMRGEAWFAKAVALNGDTSEMQPAQMRTAYLSALEQAGEFEATVPHLDWLAQGYMAMGITDDHFVWMRGFPFFGEFLDKSRKLLGQVLSESDVRAWYERMSERLDEDGRQRLQQHLGAVDVDPKLA